MAEGEGNRRRERRRAKEGKRRCWRHVLRSLAAALLRHLTLCTSPTNVSSCNEGWLENGALACAWLWRDAFSSIATTNVVSRVVCLGTSFNRRQTVRRDIAQIMIMRKTGVRASRNSSHAANAPSISSRIAEYESIGMVSPCNHIPRLFGSRSIALRCLLSCRYIWRHHIMARHGMAAKSALFTANTGVEGRRRMAASLLSLTSRRRAAWPVAQRNQQTRAAQR